MILTLAICSWPARSHAERGLPILSNFFLSQNQQESNARAEVENENSESFFAPDGKSRSANNRGYRQFETEQEDEAAEFERPRPSSQKALQKAKILEKPAPSPIESLYSRRVVSPVEQYGYDVFGVPSSETRNVLHGAAKDSPSLPAGAVQDDFTLNIGDEVEVVFSGQRADRETVRISSEGMLILKDFPPIPAAGRTMGQVRISLEAAAASLYNTQAYISLASVRQIGVLVVGHVKTPGRQNLTVFHTALDALMEAGGVQKTGSLRQIKLVRDGRSRLVDLYALLMSGSSDIDIQLRDGDRIMVPPIGPTVAVAGEVKRPGIYELLPELAGMHHKPSDKSQKVSLNDMLDFAGGVLTPGDNRMMRLTLTDEGREKVEDVSEPFARVFRDGDILMISKGLEKRSDTVELIGHTRKPGMFAISEKPNLSSLLNGEQVLGPDIYPLIGVIERWDPDQLAPVLIDFPLKLVLSGDYDRTLDDGDVVHLFSRAEIESLDKPAPKAPLEEGSASEDDPAKKPLAPVMASFLKERSAFLRGAVRVPGPYPVAQGVTLDSLLAVAGGMALEADTSNIEITSAHQGQNGQAEGRSGTHRTRVNFKEQNPGEVEVSAGDAVRVNQKFRKVEDQSVLIIGEVTNPGRYDLMPGDKMSDLLARAGGLSRYAYPDGAIFSRRAERMAEEQRFRAAARDLERSIAVALEKEDKGPSPDQVAQAQSLVAELKDVQAVGRITVEADPAVLAAQPEVDLLLEPGDRVFIPKRPMTVRVSGEVLSPAALQFRETKKPREYIDEAGGFTFNADKDRSFVLFPDGSAQPLAVNIWNHNPAFIPPGSTIVVPPEPFDFVQSAKDLSQILANLAITGVFIDDVREDN
ncbi:MAG TPA: SLBB domain-containing protein [Alphaproteobacteria bacterium]|nr:SLBB domain-containing protein [Alphaproteobacteria bacterium]